eukprot:m.328563 g.328563  ORF g.328563 m.328563 type:complete len:372 (+) comp20433_c0_seq2:2359-3474(+)
MDLTSTVECGSDILQRANATDSGSRNDDETLEQQDLRKAGFKENTIAKIIEIFEVDPDYPCACDMAKEYIESRLVEPYNFSIDNIAKLGFTDRKTEVLLSLLKEQEADESLPCHSVIEIAVESILFLQYPDGIEFVETVFPNSTGEENSVESGADGHDNHIRKRGFLYKRFGSVEAWKWDESKDVAESGCKYFHGTTSMFLKDIDRYGIVYRKARKCLDFNVENDTFYVTNDFCQAQKWATDKAHSQAKCGNFVVPVVLGFRKTEGLEHVMGMDDAPMKVFDDDTELCRFIFWCQHGMQNPGYIDLASPILDNHVYIEGKLCLNPHAAGSPTDIILGKTQIAFRFAQKKAYQSIAWQKELNDGLTHAWIGK